MEKTQFIIARLQGNPDPPRPIPRHFNPYRYERRANTVRQQIFANSAQDLRPVAWLHQIIGIETAAMNAYKAGTLRQGFPHYKLFNHVLREMRRRWDIVRLAGKHLDAYLKEFENEARLLDARGTKTKATVVPGLGVSGEPRKDEKQKNGREDIKPWYQAQRQISELRIGGSGETVRQGASDSPNNTKTRTSGRRPAEPRRPFPGSDGIFQPRAATDISPSSFGTRAASPLEKVFKQKGL